jgi:energy-coupling factor transporter ATP-binding protein EcfA2
MQNPFTTTFSKAPEYTYIHTEKTEEILRNLNYDSPTESIYKITGVRGSGKTVILAKVEAELRSEEYRKKGWVVFDLNPTRDMLRQVAAMLVEEGFGKRKGKSKSVNASLSILGTGGGFGISKEEDDTSADIGVRIEGMIQEAQKKGKKIFIGIDEVSKTPEMMRFASEFGRWIRAVYPVFLVCTGLYENIMEVSNVKNLTFFRRARTVRTEPLNVVRMADMYRRQLKVEIADARSLAEITKGYAYAFQLLGVLYFNKKEDETLEDDVIPSLKFELFTYSYEKIWEELSEGDRALVRLLAGQEEYKREEILSLMGDKKGNYSMYRDRLINRGLVTVRQGYISLSLPFFADYIHEYSL